MRLMALPTLMMLPPRSEGRGLFFLILFFLRLAALDAVHVGAGGTRRDDVHADAFRPELRGENAGHQVDGALGRGVDDGAGIGHAADGAADVDDAAAEIGGPWPVLPDTLLTSSCRS